MRMRKNPNLVKTLHVNPDIVIPYPTEYKGKWHELFGNYNPIEVEFGMGRGTFITTHANTHPQLNYIGIDLSPECIAKGLRKILDIDEPLHNIKLVALNLEFVEDVFEMGEIDKIYLTFSDPWPKARHAKRRLTHSNFLKRYKALLSPGHMLEFKTDNRPLFDFSLEEIGNDKDFEIIEVCCDLTSLNDPENVKTEYETKFVNLGQPIHRLRAICNPIKSNIDIP